jgi:hypothetical protein
VAGLIDLAVAKDHLRITDTDHDVDVQRKADAASAIVLGYLASYADPAWTSATLPEDVQAAMLIMLGHLESGYRGDEPVDPRRGDEVAKVWEAVTAILMSRRLPSMA